jgi:NAD(P)H-nitrite reductase large subunit
LNHYYFFPLKQAMTTNLSQSADEVICICSGTTRGYIEKLVQQGLDVEAISQRSGALTGCGGCEWDVAELVKALSAQKNSA